MLVGLLIMVVFWIFGGTLISAAVSLWQTKTYRLEAHLKVFVSKVAGVVIGLMGVLVIIGSFFAPYASVQQDNHLKQYTKECTEQGGIVLRLDNNGNECWQTKISEQ